MTNLWKAEPTMILAVVQAGLALGMAFGLHITVQQMALILTFTGAVLALINRSQVTSPGTLQMLTPATLAAAQDAAQPVKDAIRKLPVVLLTLTLVGGWGCATLSPKAPSNLTPPATTAFYATEVIQGLDLIRDFADGASTTSPPLISTATLLKIVNWHEDLVILIHSSPAGWKVTAETGLGELKQMLSPAEYARVQPYVILAHTLIQEAP